MDMEKIKLYFERVGLPVPETIVPDADLLRTLHRAHALSIPFENTQYLKKELFATDPQSLFRHVVLEKRGGLCLDLNGCFLWLLTELGYRAESVSAYRCVKGEKKPEFPHRVLLVTDRADVTWWCDVADTRSMMTEPLLFVPELEQTTNGERLRFHALGNALTLERFDRGKWSTLYYYDDQLMSEEECRQNKTDRLAGLADGDDVLSSPYFLLKTERGGIMLIGRSFREIINGESFTRECSGDELPELYKRFQL